MHTLLIGDDEQDSARNGLASGRLISRWVINMERFITRAVAVFSLAAGLDQGTEKGRKDTIETTIEL